MSEADSSAAKLDPSRYRREEGGDLGSHLDSRIVEGRTVHGPEIGQRILAAQLRIEDLLTEIRDALVKPTAVDPRPTTPRKS